MTELPVHGLATCMATVIQIGRSRIDHPFHFASDPGTDPPVT